MAKFHIKKGDKVTVLAGEYKGQTGTVIEMLPSKNKALVEGINVVKKHMKPSATNPQGGITEKEAPIHLSNLMYVDANGKASRVGRKEDENGKLVRYSKKTQETIK
ncbi:MAG TPA: 50S ribosomal protein L24 [Cryomorphaceae bacterium]|nr:50S ribosomal protein L24 [Owenweeksia sp.]MBF99556.1 50S ribosomal protein L24 [Owenweeksia sp.]HAD98797.1 50S ribosomal protein L24 [Cryomorphaceae bacterium]HBF19359.1 50S ribosomal protein L24 [Cryomorphaceae bacterium]|tara:strand:+ start:1310 stop:1627 length:318 start_codon:yes stop_codon:yes gene_type:complete